MPLAVTHVLISVIIVDLYRDYVTKHKRYFTLYTVFLAGVFGLLPDIDVPLGIIASIFNINLPALLQHGSFTHTPLFAFLFLIPAFIFIKKKQHKNATIFFVACFGIMLHLFLDYLIGGGGYEGIMWFFPFSLASYKIHLIYLFGSSSIPQSIDAIILLAWLYHEEVKHKISNFI